ncbi:MAG: hypothetical protein OI74_02395 [Gammaproteobacteria bacterium (ex Lamellibrachia satsuma)]|nr:MAG: hypothetical protein OI74_02395 [Gammaproteobacteria bacterium (ex Lamellibrachia satsuma)]
MTGTGLDKIIEIINTDERLQRKTTSDARAIASYSADRMNQIILESIYFNGCANDGTINAADARSINDYIHDNYLVEWVELHGDDENGVESGFHYVQNNGARTLLFGANAINQVADSIYHLGFESTRKFRLKNEDGNKNKTFMKLAHWLDTLLANELASGELANSNIQEPAGTTGTGLDSIVDAVYGDQSLQIRVSLDDMREGVRSAILMNELIIEAIEQLKLNEDGDISVEDAKEINRYLVTNHAALWAELHGDDEKNGEETGYHLVQSDGAKTYLFGTNMINKVFDGLYHLGFQAHKKGRRLLNEDGNKNASFNMVAYWLDSLINK